MMPDSEIFLLQSRGCRRKKMIRGGPHHLFNGGINKKELGQLFFLIKNHLKLLFSKKDKI